MTSTPHRLAAALLHTNAERLYQDLIEQYGDHLTGKQMVRLSRIHWRRGACAGLNLLLGQLAAQSVVIGRTERERAEAICTEWADTSRQRRVA